ncbi:DUF1501 domain-containing protein [Janthinobacterium sp. B9-8]|uniref:DUF1501 domain-containing protein n=1 Tax=Janthinobacterium sp. B9-8 TaxID=1236179 RepID=UPI00061D028B|nr:DUF1501 domain-containing protein [Janthinobacterium sp. B9-8]AMC35060.1 hypothetical protein VN23_10785 [Janthinobacterium sp. B9-8]
MDNTLSRREFLRRAGMLAATGVAAPMAFNLSLMSEAAAAASPSDYKALVCVFLAGGNDHQNTVVPYDLQSYQAYANIRQTIATPRDRLLPLASLLSDGRQMALAPQLSGLATLFAAGRLGIVANMGPLAQPTTKAQYQNHTAVLPPKLFSHNDQQSYWMSSMAEGADSGWGGRVGDLFLSGNGNAALSCISVGGNGLYLSGQQARSFAVGTGGNPLLLWGSTNLFGPSYISELKALMSSNKNNYLEDEYVKVTQRGLNTSAQLDAALKAAPVLNTSFPANNSLADSLKMVAKLISTRGQLGNQRQVFMVQLAGFDMHDRLSSQHPILLKALNDALTAFDGALTELGLQDQVTTFTGSEFGRTLSSNGDGSDHGWASHHFVMGGAVAGGQIHGRVPLPVIGGADDVGQGRYIPDLSVEQLAWPLAKWFGVPESDRYLVLPTLAKFDENALRIMKPGP